MTNCPTTGEEAVLAVTAEAGQEADCRDLQPVDVITVRSGGTEEFVANYLLPGVPCIIDDLVSDWPARAKWNRQYFLEVMGRTMVCFHHQVDDGIGLDWKQGIDQASLSEFISRIEQGEKIKHFGMAHPLYDFVSTHPDLVRDVRLQSIQRILPGGRFLGLSRLDSSFWPWIPPYPPQLYIASAGNASPGHYDPDFSHTFHWCVWGRKSVTLFPYCEEDRDRMWKLRAVDMSKPVDPRLIRDFAESRKLKGWSTMIDPGQTLFIPSRMWHFFRYEQTSMSYVVRARSFTTLESYLGFASGLQSPLKTIPFYAKLWRRIEPRDRGVRGNVLATAEWPTVKCTAATLRLLHWYVSCKRGLRNRLKRQRPGPSASTDR